MIGRTLRQVLLYTLEMAQLLTEKRILPGWYSGQARRQLHLLYDALLHSSQI